MSEDAQTKKAILLGVVLVGGLGYFGYEYAYRPAAAEITTLETRLDGLVAQNRAARILTEEGGGADMERRLGLYRDQLHHVEGLIPSSEELPDLLDAISMEAQRTGVDLALIQPVGALADEFYTRRTYDLAVYGSYHQIGEFLTRVASLRRIITPIGLNLAIRSEDGRGGDPQLEARLAIETYVLPSNLEIADAMQAD